MNESPCTTKASTKKNATENSTSKKTSTKKCPKKEKEKEKEVSPSKSPISLDLAKKIVGDLKLDYDVVADLKNMKDKITVFEL